MNFAQMLMNTPVVDNRPKRLTSEQMTTETLDAVRSLGDKATAANVAIKTGRQYKTILYRLKTMQVKGMVAPVGETRVRGHKVDVWGLK